jgi:hypothetical protein
MEQIKKLYSENRPDLSEKSIYVYLNTIKMILTKLKTDDPEIFVKEPQKVIDSIYEMYQNLNSRKNKLGVILSYLNLINDSKSKEPYNKEIVSINEQINNQLSSNKKNSKESKNWMTDSDVQTIENDLKNKLILPIKSLSDLNHYRDYVIFKLYNVLPTRNDLADSKIIYHSKADLSPEHNYIILNKKDKSINYELNNYKTYNTYGKKILKIDSKLYDMLDTYKKALDKILHTDNLLNTDTGIKMTRNRLSVYYQKLGKVVDKKITTTLNRHRAVSNVMDVEKIKDLAHTMGHSVVQAVNVYAKKN